MGFIFEHLILFDFINKNSMFLGFALVPKLVPRTVDFYWYRYRIQKCWYRDNTSLIIIKSCLHIRGICYSDR